MSKVPKHITKLLNACRKENLHCIVILNDLSNINAFMTDNQDENIISLQTMLFHFKPEAKQKNYILYH